MFWSRDELCVCRILFRSIAVWTKLLGQYCPMTPNKRVIDISPRWISTDKFSAQYIRVPLNWHVKESNERLKKIYIYYSDSNFYIIMKYSLYFAQVMCTNRSRGSVVGIATGYGLDDRGVGVRVPVESIIFSSPRHPDRYGVHPTSYPVGTGFFLSWGGKATRAWSWPLTSN
jgi:hypothetical protein